MQQIILRVGQEVQRSKSSLPCSYQRDWRLRYASGEYKGVVRKINREIRVAPSLPSNKCPAGDSQLMQAINTF